MSWGDGVDWSTPLTEEDAILLDRQLPNLPSEDKEIIREIADAMYKHFTSPQILTGALG